MILYMYVLFFKSGMTPHPPPSWSVTSGLSLGPIFPRKATLGSPAMTGLLWAPCTCTHGSSKLSKGRAIVIFVSQGVTQSLDTLGTP